MEEREDQMWIINSQPAAECRPIVYRETLVECGAFTRLAIEIDLEHTEREDYIPNGWGEARQTASDYASGGMSRNAGSYGITWDDPDWQQAEKALAEGVRRFWLGTE